MDLAQQLKWQGFSVLESRNYTCGYCGSDIASENGWLIANHNHTAKIYICHKCTRPTYFDPDGEQIPGIAFGKPVNDMPESVNSLYEEARACTTYNAFTAAVLCSRKLLMNIAVSKGAEEGKHFIEYVEYLSSNNYVPPGGHMR